ncbi:MAG: GNAT family N-acetyltransferase [Flavobacteriaceae bacterium]|nr:GNAT family N-acetyltransferase [Flavobacteriaceae bacterium]
MGNDKISYHSVEGIPEQIILDELISLYNALFEDTNNDLFLSRITNNPDLFIAIARSAEGIVGFKLGYAISEHTFYSWLGGVDPDYRKKGIANQLADIQEQWAIDKGFKSLRTKSTNQFKPMMILNLKRGFDIIEVTAVKNGLDKIVFQKSLS